MSGGVAVLNNDFVSQWAEIQSDVLAACERVGQSGWYILGKEVAAFEKALAAHWGLSFAVGMGNGMDALEIALRAGGLQPGECVITTPLSAFATSLAIIRAGGVPIFVDTDQSGLLDLQEVEALLASRPEIRWLLPVHLFGHCLDLDELARLQQVYGLRIVEDCAQSIGAHFNQQPCGSVGFAAATSFYPTKNLGAMGDGGALLTGSEEVAQSSRQWRDYGQAAKYHHSLPGLNSRLDELQAAILSEAMLPRLSAHTARRQELAAQYREGLTAGPVVPLPHPTGSGSVYHLFPVSVRGSRAELMQYLKENGIQSAIHYPLLIPDQEAFKALPHEVIGSLPRARHIAETELSLPLHPYLTDEHVAHVVSCLQRYPSPDLSHE